MTGFNFPFSFQRLFLDVTSKRAIISLPDVTTSTMKCLLSFIYTGEVSVGEENLEELLKAAEMLEIRGLANKDEQEEKESVTVSSPGKGQEAKKVDVSISQPRNLIIVYCTYFMLVPVYVVSMQF